MSKLAELYVTIRADSKQLAAGLQSVKGLTAGVAQNITNVGVAAAASFYAFERAARYVLGAYAAQEEAELRLRTAIRLRGMEGMGVEEMVVQFANARQAVTTFGDEVTMQAAAMALRFNAIRRDNLEPFLGLAQDLAAMTRQDLSSAVMSLGMALENPSMGFLRLRRAGIMFTTAEQEAIREMVKLGKTADAQAAILDKVKSKVEGMAEAYAKTFAGRAARIGNEIGDMAENLGQIIADKLGGSMEKLIVWLTKFKESMVGGGGLVPGLVKMVGATLGFATAIAVASRALVFFRSVLWGSLGPLGWIAAVVAALGAKYLDLEKVMKSVEKAWRSFTDWLASKQKIFDEIKASLTILWEEMQKIIGIDKVKLGEAWEWMKTKITEVADATIEAFQKMIDSITLFAATWKSQWGIFKNEAIANINEVVKYLAEKLPKFVWTAAVVPETVGREIAAARVEAEKQAAKAPAEAAKEGWGGYLWRGVKGIGWYGAAARDFGDIQAGRAARWGWGAVGGPEIRSWREAAIRAQELSIGALGIDDWLTRGGEVVKKAAAGGEVLRKKYLNATQTEIDARRQAASALRESIAATAEEFAGRRKAIVDQEEWMRDLLEKGKGTMGGRQEPRKEAPAPDIAQAIAKEKKKEEQWATGFVGLAEFAKQFQAAVLKPDKALKIAEDHLKEGKKANDHLEGIEEAMAKRYSPFGTQLA